jgi:hypothetical protein
MVEHQLPKLNTRVRFPSSAPHHHKNAVRNIRFPASMSRRCHHPIEGVTGSLQSIVLRVRIEPHRQTGVLVSDPRRDQRHRPMALKPVSSGVTCESVRRHARPQMFAEPCPSRTSSIKVYDGADEVCCDVLRVDVRCFGPPVSEPIAFLTLVTAA